MAWGRRGRKKQKHGRFRKMTAGVKLEGEDKERNWKTTATTGSLHGRGLELWTAPLGFPYLVRCHKHSETVAIEICFPALSGQLTGSYNTGHSCLATTKPSRNTQRDLLNSHRNEKTCLAFLLTIIVLWFFFILKTAGQKGATYSEGKEYLKTHFKTECHNP